MSQLGACSVIPGQHMWHFATQPSVDMPVTENDAAILNKLDFEPITAQLIDYLEKDFLITHKSQLISKAGLA